MANGLCPAHFDSRGIRCEKVARMIGVPEKYEMEIGAPAPISSARQHEEYLAVLERLARKANPTADEEKYGRLLAVLVDAYEQEHYSIPDASPIQVLRTLMEANG